MGAGKKVLKRFWEGCGGGGGDFSGDGGVGELRFGREKGEDVWKYGRWSCCLFLVF